MRAIILFALHHGVVQSLGQPFVISCSLPPNSGLPVDNTNMTMVVTNGEGFGGDMHVCGATPLDPFDPSFSMYCFAGLTVATWQPVFAYARTYAKETGLVQLGNQPFGISSGSEYLQCGCSSGSALGNSSGLVCASSPALYAPPEARLTTTTTTTITTTNHHTATTDYRQCVEGGQCGCYFEDTL